VKRAPKPVPVNRRPLAAFILLGLPSNWCVYVFVSSHVLANVTTCNAAPFAGCRRGPRRRLSSLRCSRPRLPGQHLLASPGCHRVYFDVNVPQRTSSDWLLLTRPTGLASMTTAKMTLTIRLRTGRAKTPRTTLLPSSRLLYSVGANAICGAFGGLEPRRCR
jgi:hypothetical protein